jgi:hypothetical protein
MSEQPNQVATVHLPSADDRDGWYAHWKAPGMSWRREPEIDAERPAYLDDGRRTVRPDIVKGIYPFKDIRLSRADVEWLLATPESGGVRGPVDWSGASQQEREGLDLRGANLSKADLHGLPLARIHAGPNLREWLRSRPERRAMAAVHLAGADLTQAHLEEAFVGDAHLEGGRIAAGNSGDTRSQGTTTEVHLPADLREVFFDSATKLVRATLGSVDFGFVSVGDAHWGGVNLAVLKWPHTRKGLDAFVLGDDRTARQSRDWHGNITDADTRLTTHEEAVRANRQLAMVLREQGLNEEAARFAYRAQVLQRQVLRPQHRYLAALGSWLLDLISGCGYQPLRAFIAYALVILAFAGLYLLNAQFAAPHLTWDESLVLGISGFHGRGFFSSDIHLGDMLARLAAGEAVIGLLIEISPSSPASPSASAPGDRARRAYGECCTRALHFRACV